MSRRKPSICPDRLAAIKSPVPMAALVAEDIPLQRAGREYVALCPFHAERSPSYRVYPDGHAYCFGCGWYGDQIRWLMEYRRLGFLGAVQHLRIWAGIIDPAGVDIEIESRQPESEWRSIYPVPADAPELLTSTGCTVRVFNPKRAGERFEWSSWRPATAHPYLSEAGELLGFVLRVVPPSGRKFTPTVTFCENPEGARRWCIFPFARPAPLYALDRIAARPNATVVLVEGEKTATPRGDCCLRWWRQPGPAGATPIGMSIFRPCEVARSSAFPTLMSPAATPFMVGRIGAAGMFPASWSCWPGSAR
jgi:hypothetical protein